MLPAGGDAAAVFAAPCDVIAESKRAPVQLSTASKPRHCDVIASVSDTLLMTSLGSDVVYTIHSGISRAELAFKMP